LGARGVFFGGEVAWQQLSLSFSTGGGAFAPLGNRFEFGLRRGSLMDPERERTGRHLKKGRKRRRAPNTLVGAAEAMRARWTLEERQPEAKKARLSTILFAENCEVTHDQLCELLKYAVLGKSSVPKPSWCQLFHQNHLNNVVVFVLQGMSQLHFYRFYLEFGFLRKSFRHKFRLPPPSSNFLADIIGLQKKQVTGDLSKMVEGMAATLV